MQVQIEVPGVSSASVSGKLSENYELYIEKVYSQSASGSAVMKVAGHLLNICHNYPHAKQITVRFDEAAGLTWEQKRMLKNHIAAVQKLYPSILIWLMGVK